MIKEKSIYDELGEERKTLQDSGLLPSWVTTIAWQMLKENYLSETYPDLKSVYTRVANHAASYTTDKEEWSLNSLTYYGAETLQLLLQCCQIWELVLVVLFLVLEIF